MPDLFWRETRAPGLPIRRANAPPRRSKEFPPELPPAFIAALYRQISACDHDTHWLLPHRSEHEVRQTLEGLARLDFQHDSQMTAAKLPQSRLKLNDVALMAHE